LRIDSYGTVDELNSFIGLLSSHVTDETTNKVLREIQDRLFTIGSSLACDPEKEPKMKLPDLKEEDIQMLEKEIDEMNTRLKPMKSFILPGGNTAVSTAHVARCVCRRAERHCVRMMEEGMFIEPLVIKYLNRLSDHLFVLSRYIAHLSGVKEIEWKARINTHPH
jgi:cob(I)alamin adenosyltransferase